MRTNLNLNSKIKLIFHKALSKYLLVTNVVSSGILMSAGDTFEQVTELKYDIHPKGYFDWRRMVNMTAVGFLIGCPQHFFYLHMDKYLPGNKNRTVLKKILLDQFIASPGSIAIFFLGLGVLEHGDFSYGYNELKMKFTTVYMMDWLFWPPTQFINFYYLPTKYRVLYVNGMTMLYDVFLSYVKFIHSPKGSD